MVSKKRGRVKERNKNGNGGKRRQGGKKVRQTGREREIKREGVGRGDQGYEEGTRCPFPFVNFA